MENKKQYVYTFETLDTWKKSIEFAKIIYKITDSFPNSEKFGFGFSN